MANKMTDKSGVISFPNGHDLECPICSSKSVVTRYEEEQFEYGSKQDDAVQLAATIPVRRCSECGFEYTDSDAEEIKHAVVCAYLGRMNPAEIRELRSTYKLTRKQFSELTLIGEASLARWETGELIQNAAYDNFLYLLKLSENMHRLRDKGKFEVPAVDAEAGIADHQKEKFRALKDYEEAAARAKNFRLVAH